MRHSKTIPSLGALALIVAAVAAGGCGQEAGVIFPPLPKPIVWPGPPDPPRLRYVGQLATDGDLKPAVSFAQGFSASIFGKSPVHAMLSPYALCTDGKDRLFVTDSNAQCVHVFNLDSRRYEEWKPAKDQPLLSQPVGVAYDPAGRLLVSDSVGGTLAVFDEKGQCTARLGAGVLQRPCGLAVEPGTRRIFVADSAAHQVVVLDAQGALVRRIGERGGGPGQFNYPTNVALGKDGRLYVSDSLNFRVQVFDAQDQPLQQIGHKGDLPGYFSQPKGLALDSEGHLYTVDANFEAVQVFDAEGRVLLTFGEEGRDPGQFWLPAGIHIDAHDRLWIADTYNRRVQVFDYLPAPDPLSLRERVAADPQGSPPGEGVPAPSSAPGTPSPAPAPRWDANWVNTMPGAATQPSTLPSPAPETKP